MAYVMVDVETDGPIPGDYSMVCFGTVERKPIYERNPLIFWKVVAGLLAVLLALAVLALSRARTPNPLPAKSAITSNAAVTAPAR